MKQNRYDLVILGGGMVGLAMAAALAESDLSILLVEKQDLKPLTKDRILAASQALDPSVSDSDYAKDLALRVSAISPGNRAFLTQIGAWQHLPVDRLASYQSMKVWDADGQGQIQFNAAELAQPDLGVILENHRLQAALLKQINSYGNIQQIFDNGVEAIQQQPDCIQLELQDGQQIAAKLLIAADGAHSKARQLLAIETSEMDYQQTAFVANVKTQHPHQDTAWQRFTSRGPVAFLPLPRPHLCSVVWSLDEAQAKVIKKLQPQAFAKQLEAAFEARLGGVELVSDFAGFPLVKRHAKDYLSNRAVLIGDAAHSIHPLAGQGVNIGFQDAEALAALIIQLKQQNRDWSLQANLRAFERARKTDNLLVQNAMSGFKHLFASDNLLLTLGRNWGMNLLDKTPFVKNEIIKKAMGL